MKKRFRARFEIAWKGGVFAPQKTISILFNAACVIKATAETRFLIETLV
jgi:hypothetical protein